MIVGATSAACTTPAVSETATAKAILIKLVGFISLPVLMRRAHYLHRLVRYFNETARASACSHSSGFSRTRKAQFRSATALKASTALAEVAMVLMLRRS